MKVPHLKLHMWNFKKFNILKRLDFSQILEFLIMNGVEPTLNGLLLSFSLFFSQQMIKKLRTKSKQQVDDFHESPTFEAAHVEF